MRSDRRTSFPEGNHKIKCAVMAMYDCNEMADQISDVNETRPTELLMRSSMAAYSVSKAAKIMSVSFVRWGSSLLVILSWPTYSNRSRSSGVSTTRMD